MERTDTLFQIKVSGAKARFDARDKKGSTYLVPTYVALQGICSSISWAPGMNWVVDRVRIINPIRKLVNDHQKEFLINVEYRIEAHIEWGDQIRFPEDQKKHLAITRRRLNQGVTNNATLGDKGCPATIEACDFESGEGVYDLLPRTEFGRMFHSMVTKDGESYARAYQDYIMQNGVIKFLPASKCEKVQINQNRASASA